MATLSYTHTEVCYAGHKMCTQSDLQI
jgi:hypothetical protein